MIRITTYNNDKDAVKESFICEFARMILCGMALPRESEAVEQVKTILAGELEMSDTETGFTVGNENPDYDLDVQGCAFSVASEMLGKNSYTDEFGSDEACMTFVAERLLEQYPGIGIEAEIFLDTEWSNTVEIVRTVDGHIETEIEER